MLDCLTIDYKSFCCMICRYAVVIDAGIKNILKSRDDSYLSPGLMPQDIFYREVQSVIEQILKLKVVLFVWRYLINFSCYFLLSGDLWVTFYVGFVSLKVFVKISILYLFIWVNFWVTFHKQKSGIIICLKINAPH